MFYDLSPLTKSRHKENFLRFFQLVEPLFFRARFLPDRFLRLFRSFRIKLV